MWVYYTEYAFVGVLDGWRYACAVAFFAPAILVLGFARAPFLRYLGRVHLLLYGFTLGLSILMRAVPSDRMLLLHGSLATILVLLPVAHYGVGGARRLGRRYRRPAVAVATLATAAIALGAIVTSRPAFDVGLYRVSVGRVAAELKTLMTSLPPGADVTFSPEAFYPAYLHDVRGSGERTKPTAQRPKYYVWYETDTQTPPLPGAELIASRIGHHVYRYRDR